MLGDPNPSLTAITGKVGDLVYYKHPTKPGVLIIRTQVERTAPTREKEGENRLGFGASNRLARALMAIPEKAAIYNALGRVLNRQPYRIALSDALKEPEIGEINVTGYTGKPGEKVRITATDNVGVASLEVRILTLSGSAIEEGQATRLVLHDPVWTYTTQKEIAAGETVQVEACAQDFAGNRTTRQVERACGPRNNPSPS